MNDGGNMAIRNGDQVKFMTKKGELKGQVLRIPHKGLNKGCALIQVPELEIPIWIDICALIPLKV